MLEFFLKTSATAATTKFKGINVKGKYCSQKGSHGYQLNTKLTLGAMVS